MRSRLFARTIVLKTGIRLHIPTGLAKWGGKLVQTKTVLGLFSLLVRIAHTSRRQSSFLSSSTDIGRIELPSDDRSAAALLIFGYLPHEYVETLYLCLLGLRAQTILDIGAQYGWYSGLLAQTNPAAAVFAFEPDPQSYECLRRNLGSLPNLTLFEQAVSSAVGVARLAVSSARGLNSIVREVGPIIHVNQTTVDEFCQMSSCGTIDLIKCDVEGAEIEVLIGARDLIQHSDAPIWMIEVVADYLHEAAREPNDILEMLSSLSPDTACYEILPNGLPEVVSRFRTKVHSNVFVVPAHRHDDFAIVAETVHRLLRPSSKL